MAITNSIPPGMATTMSQNVIMALPPNKAVLFCNNTTPAFEASNDISFATKVALTLTNGQATVAGGFIRSTGATPVVVTLARD